MQDANRPAGRRTRSWRRPFLVGFLIGIVVTVPAAVLALIFTGAEVALPWVVPGLLLTRALAPFMQTWPGALNLALAALANGLVYGLVAVAVVAAVRLARRPARQG
jgi:hypothetical protein